MRSVLKQQVVRPSWSHLANNVPLLGSVNDRCVERRSGLVGLRVDSCSTLCCMLAACRLGLPEKCTSGEMEREGVGDTHIYARAVPYHAWSVTALAALPISSSAIATPLSTIGRSTKRQSGALLNGQNFADPSLIQVGDTVYGYATTGGGKNIQMASVPAAQFDQPDQTWTASDADAFPNVPSWAAAGTTWAPDVAQFTDFDDSFGLYYTAKTTLGPNGGVHCLGLARNLNNPEGPFSDGSTQPWMNAQGFECQVDQGGQIDPALFVDSDGSWYITYKIDGSAACPRNDAPSTGVCGGQAPDYVAANCPSTKIMLHKLGTNADGQVDGYTLDQDHDAWPMTMIDNDGAQDNYNVEAPSIVLSSDGSTYFLFFSRGCYNDASYKLSYTYANSITGPWTNPRTDLLMTGSVAGDGSSLYAPGGADITLVDALMVFHGDFGDTDGSVRALYTGTLQWDGNSATLGPDHTNLSPVLDRIRKKASPHIESLFENFHLSRLRRICDITAKLQSPVSYNPVTDESVQWCGGPADLVAVYWGRTARADESISGLAINLLLLQALLH
nr:hypothetical protein CFP56_44470 [Quercus suber]